MKKSKLKKLSKAVVIFIAISGASYAGYSYTLKSTQVAVEVPSFTEEKVKMGDIKLNFDTDGEAEISVSTLDFSISGELSELNVQVGQEIKKGDVVARIDDADYAKNIENAQLDYDQALVKLEKTKKNYDLSVLSEKQKLEDLKSKLDKAALDNEAQLLAEKQKVDDAKAKFEKTELEYLPMLEIPDAYPKQEIDQKRISYENDKAAYETQKEKYRLLEEQLNFNLGSDKSAYEAQLARYNMISQNKTDIQIDEMNLKDAEMKLQAARDNLSETILTAPVDGKILEICYNIGETVSASNGNNEITSDSDYFILLSNSENVQVVTAVSEEDLNNVSIGQEIEVEFEAFDNKVFHGKVVDIDNLPQKDNNGIVNYDVTLELEDGTEEIKTGMSCSVEFILKQKKDVLIISNKAITMVDGKQTVQVKDEQGNIVSKTVVTGLTDGKYCEVIEGLKVGETVIIKD